MTELRFIPPSDLAQIHVSYSEARYHNSEAYDMELECAVCSHQWGQHRGLLCPSSMVQGRGRVFPEEGDRFTTFEPPT